MFGIVSSSWKSYVYMGTPNAKDSRGDSQESLAEKGGGSNPGRISPSTVFKCGITGPSHT